MKRQWRGLLAALLAGGLLAQALPVAAALSGGSPASVEFETGDTRPPVRPVDPDRPGSGGSGGGGDLFLPGEGVEELPLAELPQGVRSEPGSGPATTVPVPGRIPGETGAGGWLTINYVTPLRFSVPLGERTWGVNARRPNLQLSDRRGTAGGWKVTALAGELVGADGQRLEAVLRLQNGMPRTASSVAETPRAPALVELPLDAASERLVLSAQEGQGVGTWVLCWYPVGGAYNDLQLELLGDSRARWGTGWVLWSLCDAP